jgi:4-nitrophenyl phosphatase
LERIRAVLFDMDGVIYVGQQRLPGVQELWDFLDQRGIRWLCVTNNASQASQQFSEKLARMGLHAGPERILGSAEATALWMADQVENHGAPEGLVYVMGMAGLRSELERAGFTLTDDPFAATYAVSGANFSLTFDDLANTTLAIRNGARFIGTNPDVTFPTERGQIPGAGSVLALLATASDVKPIVIGKPFAPMYELAMRRLKSTPETTLMVGDRYDTDITGAAALGMTTAGVLTGISTREEFLEQNPPPDIIVPGLVELFQLMGGAKPGS